MVDSIFYRSLDYARDDKRNARDDKGYFQSSERKGVAGMPKQLKRVASDQFFMP